MTKKCFVSAIVFSCALALGTPALGEDAKKAAAPAGGAKSVDEAWEKAIVANDLDAIVACYAPDAVMWGPGEAEAKGEKAIRASYAALLKDNTVKEAKTSDTQYRTTGKTSVGWGHFSMTMQPKAGGAPVTMKGRFNEIAAEKDGKWLYIVDHASVEPAPPAPAAPPAKK